MMNRLLMALVLCLFLTSCIYVSTEDIDSNKTAVDVGTTLSSDTAGDVEIGVITDSITVPVVTTEPITELPVSTEPSSTESIVTTESVTESILTEEPIPNFSWPAPSFLFYSFEDLELFLEVGSLDFEDYQKMPEYVSGGESCFAESFDTFSEEMKPVVAEYAAVYRNAEYLSPKKIFDIDSSAYEMVAIELLCDKENIPYFRYWFDNVVVEIQHGGPIPKWEGVKDNYGFYFHPWYDETFVFGVNEFLVSIEVLGLDCDCDNCRKDFWEAFRNEEKYGPFHVCFEPNVSEAFYVFADKIIALEAELKQASAE